MNSEARYYAIVTGSSQGLGRAIAEQLALRKHNLLLAALPGTGLPELADSLADRYKISARFLETDLMRVESPRELLEYAKTNNLTVDILVNNVGIGHGGAIGEYTDEAVEQSIFLNMRCTTLMTNTFSGELCRRGRAYILNIGSFSGFSPMPYKSIYAASKAYLYHFSISVGEELHGTGVSVSVAMPGPVKTNRKVLERIAANGKGAIISSLEADEAAREIISQMFRRKKVIIPGRFYKMLYAVESVLPYGILMRMTRNTFKGID